MIIKFKIDYRLRETCCSIDPLGIPTNSDRFVVAGQEMDVELVSCFFEKRGHSGGNGMNKLLCHLKLCENVFYFFVPACKFFVKLPSKEGAVLASLCGKDEQ